MSRPGTFASFAIEPTTSAGRMPSRFPTALELLAQRRLEDLDPARGDVGARRHLHRLDLRAGEALDLAHHPTFARRDEQRRHAGPAGPPGAADAVHVDLDVVRDVVVDDVG